MRGDEDQPLLRVDAPGPGRFYPIFCSHFKNNNSKYLRIVLLMRTLIGHFQPRPATTERVHQSLLGLFFIGEIRGRRPPLSRTGRITAANRLR